MSSMSSKNSAAAHAYAEKKKAALEKANRLAAERRRKQELQVAASNNSDDRTSLDRYQSRNVIGSAGGAEVESVFSSDFAERLIIRPSQRSSSNPDSTLQHTIEPMGNMKNTAFTVDRAQSLSRPKNRAASSVSGATPPSLMESALPKPSSTVTTTVRTTHDGSLTVPHTFHFSSNHDDIFLSPPLNSSGVVASVSDLPILCSCPITSSAGNGIAVGGADHRAYVVIPSSAKNQAPRVTTLGSRTDGHSDWVTGVGVLNEHGIVATTAMDGKLCLWSVATLNSTTRSLSAPVRCQQVMAHRGSISKLLVDTVSAKCFTFGYDGYTHLWDVSSCRGGKRSALAPMMSFQGRGPIIEGHYVKNILLTGDRSGGLLVYDVSTGAAVVKYAAHKGAVTGIVSADMSEQNRVYATGGGDGFVKVLFMFSEVVV